MLLLLVLFGLIGVSLLTFLVSSSAKSQTCASGRAAYANPPSDWPDIPIAALRLFDRSGQINKAMPVAQSPARVASFDAAQAIVLAQVRSCPAGRKEIALRLSPDDAGWTDVLLDGSVLAQVPTSEMRARVAGRAQAA